MLWAMTVNSGYELLVCANDEEAITKANVLSQRHGVKLWSGPG
jgi:hypothetical protein